MDGNLPDDKQETPRTNAQPYRLAIPFSKSTIRPITTHRSPISWGLPTMKWPWQGPTPEQALSPSIDSVRESRFSNSRPAWVALTRAVCHRNVETNHTIVDSLPVQSQRLGHQLRELRTTFLAYTSGGAGRRGVSIKFGGLGGEEEVQGTWVLLYVTADRPAMVGSKASLAASYSESSGKL